MASLKAVLQSQAASATPIDRHWDLPTISAGCSKRWLSAEMAFRRSLMSIACPGGVTEGITCRSPDAQCPITRDGRCHAPAARSMAAFQLSSTSSRNSASSAHSIPRASS